MGKLIDLTGKRFGRWSVIKRGPNSARVRWECQCDCGKIALVQGVHLSSGKSTNCGCYRPTGAANWKWKGYPNEKPEYHVWHDIRSRCNTPTNRSYSYYGGRGIRVCEAWQNSFDVFYADMGPRPTDKHTIERIEVNGDYEPGNCKWATRLEQAQNTRRNVYVLLNGERMCLSEAARRLGLTNWQKRQAISRGVLQRAP